MMTCPKHGTLKIRSGPSKKPGGGINYWCATLLGVGQPNTNPSGYCNIKPVDVPDQAPTPAPVAPVSTPAPNVAPEASQAFDVSRGTLACAALTAASRLAQSPEETILMADRYLHGFLLRAANGLPPDVEGLPF